MRVIKTTNTKENLCDTCPNRCNFPECCPSEVEFGNGIGNDNIISCSNCLSPYSNTVYPSEIAEKD